MPVNSMPGRPALSHHTQRNKRVYAIAFDLNTKAAERLRGPNYQHCYTQIANVLAEHGFVRMQGSLFFGDANSDAVRCFMAVQDLDRRYPWFGQVVTDLRMLRVDENNDLLPILSNELRFDGIAANA